MRVFGFVVYLICRQDIAKLQAIGTSSKTSSHGAVTRAGYERVFGLC